MLRNRKLISIVSGLSFLLISITAPAYSAPAKPPQLKMPTGIVVTPSSSLPGEFTVSWAPVNNATYTVRVYGAVGKTLLTLDRTTLSPTSIQFTGTPATTYRVTVQAISTNPNLYSNSPESGKYSVTTYQTISVAAIAGVTAPVTGATPVTTTTAGTGYTGTVIWSESPATFASGTVYTATITLTPTTGYTLQGVAADFFTVAGATTDTNSVNSGVITAVFPATATTISEAAVAGVTAPVTGATPVTTTTAGTGYTGTVIWSESPATFASGTVYTATITLTPTTGYTLQGVAADFFTVAGATTDTNSVNSGVITAVFPATLASPSSGSFEFTANSYLTLTPGLNFDPTPGIIDPFTIELWFKTAASFHAGDILGATSGNGLSFILDSSTRVKTDSFGVGSKPYQFANGVALLPNTWYHIAISRDSTGQEAVWLDGARANTCNQSSDYENCVSGFATDNFSYSGTSREINRSAICPHCVSGGSRFDGEQISEMRVVIGTNVYDPTLITIAVPTQPLQSITNTKFLLAANGGEPIDASTNQTIVNTGGVVNVNATAVCGSDGMRTSGGSGACQVGDIGPGGELFTITTRADFTVGLDLPVLAHLQMASAIILKLRRMDGTLALTTEAMGSLGISKHTVVGITDESSPNNSSTELALAIRTLTS